jgi:2-octaprenyl-6-methoxyphenol hydroxylase
LLLAEGKPPGDAERKDYGQTAIVSEAWSAQPHEARAFERFTPEGPLALLPLERGYSVVWCMRDEHARAKLALDDAGFLAELTRATAFAQRSWVRVAARTAFPLSLVHGGDAAPPRCFALGNAAQTLHPVAGQGLNLGLRDAFELTDALKPGLSNATLAQYARQRKRDRAATIALTDHYVSLFSNQLVPLRVARGAGLALFNLVPPLRAAIARRMMFGLR